MLKCNATGDRPITVKWTNKDGVKIDNLSEHRYEISEIPTHNGVVSELSIRSVQKSDASIFKCDAENLHGKDDRTIKLAVVGMFFYLAYLCFFFNSFFIFLILQKSLEHRKMSRSMKCGPARRAFLGVHRTTATHQSTDTSCSTGENKLLLIGCKNLMSAVHRHRP